MMVVDSFVLVTPLATGSRLHGTGLAASFLGFPVEEEPMVEAKAQQPSTITSAVQSEPFVDEAIWRYAKRPLLSISAKRGIAMSHANSLRELLQAHTMVKVKIVSITTGTWDAQDFAKQGRQREEIVQRAMELMQAATETGAPSDLELLEARPGMRQVLIGLPGTRSRIEQGDFPPPSPPPRPVHMRMHAESENGEDGRTSTRRPRRSNSPRERWSLKKKKERALENRPRPRRKRPNNNNINSRNED